MDFDDIKTVLLAVFVIAVVLTMPLAVIWSLNTLFPGLAIPYTWSTYFATFLLQTPFVYTRNSK